MDKIIFAAGCFWGIEKKFDTMRGVVSTRVGYTGGHSKQPTYREVCGKNTGHAEAVEVIFDPNEISYKSLLDAFFQIHDATSVTMQGQNNTGQYRSAIFYTSSEQGNDAKAYIKALEAEAGQDIYTQVAEAQDFWEAEANHQKYYLKHSM